MSISAQVAQARIDYFNNPATAAEGVPESLGTIGGAAAEARAEESLSFHDVLSAINPLNHIPVVSDLYATATEQKPSGLSRVVGLVGSTLLGGPVGFIASLASMAFEGATGQTPVQMVASAVTGNIPETQLAQAEPSAHVAAAMAASTHVPQPEAPSQIAQNNVPPVPARTTVNPVLELYGASPASAHASYRTAQLRPYLEDVTVSKVL